MAYISRITIPDGNTYDIKDTSAWTQIGNLWNVINQGALELVVAEQLPTASVETKGKLYLIPHSHGTRDIYDEYVTVQSGSGDNIVYTWEKIGNTDIDLSAYSLNTHVHTYSGTTESSGTHTHDVSLTRKYIQTINVPTTFSSEQVVKRLSDNKLDTSSISVLEDGSFITGSYVQVVTPDPDTIYNVLVTEGHSIATSHVDSIGAATVTINPTSSNRATGNLGTATTTRTEHTPMWGASVNDSTETLSFVFKPLSTASTLTTVTASTNANTITTTDVSVYDMSIYSNAFLTGEKYKFYDVSVPVAASKPISVATGSVSQNGSGSAVITGAAEYANPFTDISTSATVLRNSLADTATAVRIVTDASIQESGAHTHTYSGNTSEARDPGSLP